MKYIMVILLVLLFLSVNVNIRLYFHLKESQEAQMKLLKENIALLEKELI